MSGVGCLLTAAGLALGIFVPRMGIPAAVLVSLGNAAFHVGAGVSVIKNAGGRMSHLGVFVSTGAVGLALGKITQLYIPILAILAVCGIFTFFAAREGENAEYIRFSAAPKRPAFAILALCAVGIVLRAFGGFVMPQAPLSGSTAIILPAFAAALGKASGGFLADRLGARRVGVISLIFAAALIALGNVFGTWALLCAVVFFNMTMPIALGSIVSVLPDSPGLAFGIPTLSLLIGTVPIFFWRPDNGGALSIVLCAVSIVCFALSTGNGNIKGGRHI